MTERELTIGELQAHLDARLDHLDNMAGQLLERSAIMDAMLHAEHQRGTTTRRLAVVALVVSAVVTVAAIVGGD